jgi:ketosteroid isomerase-like protein
MSQENVEILRRAFEAFARGDFDYVLDRLDPDVEWQSAGMPILGVEALHGREAVKRFFTRDLFEGFDRFRSEPLTFEDLGGDFVLVMVRYIGRGESSGIEMDQRFAALYQLRDGKVVTMRDYSTRAEAPEAAGLSE